MSFTDFKYPRPHRNSEQSALRGQNAVPSTSISFMRLIKQSLQTLLVPVCSGTRATASHTDEYVASRARMVIFIKSPILQGSVVIGILNNPVDIVISLICPPCPLPLWYTACSPCILHISTALEPYDSVPGGRLVYTVGTYSTALAHLTHLYRTICVHP